MEENQEEILKSKYNEAGNQLSRLNGIWLRCHFYRQKGNLFLWRINLDNAWAELAGNTKFIKQKHITKCKSFRKLIFENSNNRINFFQVLLEFEIWLRQIQDEQGKGTKYENKSYGDYE